MGDQSLAWAGGWIQGGCSKIALSYVREPGQPASMWAQAPLGKLGDSGGEHSRKLGVHPFRGGLCMARRGWLLARGSILMGPDWLLLPPWGSLSLGPVATLTHLGAPWLSRSRPVSLS